MPDWLQTSFQHDQLAASVIAMRLFVSLALGGIVAIVYRLSHSRSRRPQAPGLIATLVMLTVLIAMVTLVIANSANSVALAFSLVGALSIVRFRTVVEDTRDTAFVILAVAVGMAVGAGFLAVPLIGIPVAAIAALVCQPRGNGAAVVGGVLTVRVGVGQDSQTILRAPFEQHLLDCRLLATATARQGAAFELTYSVRLRHDSAHTLVTILHAVEGIQNVELKLHS